MHKTVMQIYIYIWVCPEKKGSLPPVHRHQLASVSFLTLGGPLSGLSLGLPRGCGDFRPRPGGRWGSSEVS